MSMDQLASHLDRMVSIMPVMDEFREERDSIKKSPFSRKFRYFVDYYLPKILFAAVIIGIIIAFTHSILTQKEEVMMAALVNIRAVPETEAEVLEPFQEKYVTDPEKEMITVDTTIAIQVTISSNGTEQSMESLQDIIKYDIESEERLMALVMTNSMDLFISGDDVFDRYNQQEWFCDLREVLPEDLYQTCEEEGVLVYRNGVPVGVSLKDNERFNRYYVYIGSGNEDIVAGIVYTGAHKEMGVNFLRFIMQGV